MIDFMTVTDCLLGKKSLRSQLAETELKLGAEFAVVTIKVIYCPLPSLLHRAINSEVNNLVSFAKQDKTGTPQQSLYSPGVL